MPKMHISQKTDEPANGRKKSFNKYLALSDVDGTITKGSLVLEHAIYLHNKGIINLGSLPERWNNDRKNEKLITELAMAYKKAITGKTLNELDVDSFLKDYMEGDHFYSTFETLKTLQKRRGWDVHLVSGSPEFLVSKFGEKFGFTSKGSVYHTDEDGRFTGDVDGMFGASQKAAHVSRLRLKNYKRILAFGDTASDKPLFDVADHSTLVDPNEDTKQKMNPSTTIYH